MTDKNNQNDGKPPEKKGRALKRAAYTFMLLFGLGVFVFAWTRESEIEKGIFAVGGAGLTYGGIALLSKHSSDGSMS